eukprot:TCALIF_04814-PA protein Name:"Protein of unknown function" AED:0.61 eAED:0.61 QI:89/0/0/0.33/1/0.66/3/0/50
MTAETDFGDPASSVQSAVQGSINDYRLTLFITSSRIKNGYFKSGERIWNV